MQCSNCHASLPETAHFCYRCGHDQGVTTRVAPTVPIGEHGQSGFRVGPVVWLSVAALTGIVITGAVLLAALGADWFFPEAKRPLQQQREQRWETKPTTEPTLEGIVRQPAPAVQPTLGEPQAETPPQTRTIIIDSGFRIEPRQFHYVQTQVLRPARLIGSFKAQGSFASDIGFSVLDERGFAEYRSGGPYHYIYNSVKVVNDSVDIPLQPGLYYIAFDNRHAGFLSKTVQAHFELQ